MCGHSQGVHGRLPGERRTSTETYIMGAILKANVSTDGRDGGVGVVAGGNTYSPLVLVTPQSKSCQRLESPHAFNFQIEHLFLIVLIAFC